MVLCCSINRVVLVSKLVYEVMSVKRMQRNTTVVTRILMAYLGTIAEFSSSQESWTAYVERLVQYLAANIAEFSSSQESWTAYVERLVQYLAANKIEDADQQ